MNPMGKCWSCDGKGTHRLRALHVAGEVPVDPPCPECAGKGQIEYVMVEPAMDEVMVEVRFSDKTAVRLSRSIESFIDGEGLIVQHPGREERVLARFVRIELGWLYVFEEVRFGVIKGGRDA